MYIALWLLMLFEANWRRKVPRPVVYHDDVDDDPEMWGDGFV